MLSLFIAQITIPFFPPSPLPHIDNKVITYCPQDYITVTLP